MAFSLVRAAGAGRGGAAVPAAPANGPRAVSSPPRPPPPPGLASRAGTRRSHALGRGPHGAVWGGRGGAGSFLVTQAFGLKGAAALRGRPLGPRSCACRLPGASNVCPDGSWPRGREPGRPHHFLLPQPSHVRAGAAGSVGGGGGSRLSSVALASRRRRQGLAAPGGGRSERRRPPDAGSALGGRGDGDARHDGAADMAPLKPRTPAPRAGRALSEPREVTWLHTFDCSWSPSPEGGPGQVRSRVRAWGRASRASPPGTPG